MRKNALEATGKVEGAGRESTPACLQEAVAEHEEGVGVALRCGRLEEIQGLALVLVQPGVAVVVPRPAALFFAETI